MTIRVTIQYGRLICRSEGDLVPWIGLALRGLVLQHFKDSVCEFGRKQSRVQWRQCHQPGQSCPHLADCHYGRAFESPSPRRMLLLSPQFPAPACAVRGLSLPIRLVAVGIEINQALPALQHALQTACEDGRGLGLVTPVRFDYQTAEVADFTWDSRQLPLEDDGVRVDRLQIPLLTPLILKRRTPGRQREVCRLPSLEDLFKASAKVVQEAFKCQGQPLIADLQQLISATRSASTSPRSAIRHLEQWHRSRRAYAPRPVQAISGVLEYTHVPQAVLPWLAMAGVLHVGEHRVAGAGHWMLADSRLPAFACTALGRTANRLCNDHNCSSSSSASVVKVGYSGNPCETPVRVSIL